MTYLCCLAGIDRRMVPMFGAVFTAAGVPAAADLARLDVAELRKLGPDLLVCDIDGLEIDSLELLRQIRFVLPDALIAVYTGDMKRTWGVACHLAGANCLLSKESSERDLTAGVRDAMWSGCYTDPRFGRTTEANFSPTNTR
jgi:DNA-binding NarL/FixJ family response regulator